MCGICGIVGPPDFKVDREQLDRSTDLMEHRGPDERGIWISPTGSVGLGARRLSIIGIENGTQPIMNEDGSCVLVANAEIYNYDRLRMDLESRGHKFRTDTDIEVMLHLYEEMGEDFATLLNGMFAFAIWDEPRRRLVLGRDRMGIRPLSYARHEGRLMFASEIKSIICDASFPRRVNHQAMHDYFGFDYVPGDQTIFEGIFRVPAGCVMVFNGQTSCATRYWDVEFQPSEEVRPVQFYLERVRELLSKSVTSRLMSDVPVGVLLSGGMDSSAITAFMARESSEPIKTFSIGFEEASFNELEYAKMVAEQFDTEHHEMVLTAKEALAVLESHIRYFDEPYADGAAIPTYYICKLASEKVKVVLSGEGGDEIFAGYDTHAAYRLAQSFRKVPSFVRNGLLKRLIDLLPVSDKKISFDFKARRFIHGVSLPVPDAHLFWRVVLTESEKTNLYSDELRAKLKVEASERIFGNLFASCPAEDHLNRLLYIDSKVFLPDDLFVKNDRMSMAHSVEARVPMTDPDLVEFMGTVPVKTKLKGFKKKYLLREAMRGILSDTIVDKKKIGLDMPFGKWLKHEFYDFMCDTLGSQRFSESGLFNQNYINGMIADHVANRRNNGRALWGLVNFAIWYNAYM